jgi:hypothetical protein
MCFYSLVVAVHRRAVRRRQPIAFHPQMFGQAEDHVEVTSAALRCASTSASVIHFLLFLFLFAFCLCPSSPSPCPLANLCQAKQHVPNRNVMTAHHCRLPTIANNEDPPPVLLHLLPEKEQSNKDVMHPVVTWPWPQPTGGETGRQGGERQCTRFGDTDWTSARSTGALAGGAEQPVAGHATTVGGCGHCLYWQVNLGSCCLPRTSGWAECPALHRAWQGTSSFP